MDHDNVKERCKLIWMKVHHPAVRQERGVLICMPAYTQNDFQLSALDDSMTTCPFSDAPQEDFCLNKACVKFLIRFSIGLSLFSV